MTHNTTDSVSFLSFNAQFLFNKMAELESLVLSMDSAPLFIAVTETWCQDSDIDSLYLIYGRKFPAHRSQETG